MAITILENGTERDLLVVDKTAYMFTVGRKNGVGKIFQPGTRGRVLDDCAASASRPNFTFIFAGTGEFVHGEVADVTKGYFATWVDDIARVPTIRNQSNAPYTDRLGLSSYMLNHFDSLNRQWLYPCEITNFNYAIDTSRWGDKPVNGTYTLNNYSGIRGFQLPNNRIYKWETHIIVAVPNNFDAIDFRNIYLCLIPYYSGGNEYYVAAGERRTVGSDENFYGYKYFSAEHSVDLMPNSIVYPPVIEIARISSSGSRWYNKNFFVQAKYCFKDD